MGPCLGKSGVDQQTRLKGYKLQIEDRTLIVSQKIASGAYGDIWKCKDTKNGQLLAAKEIKFQSIELSQMYNKQSKWLQKLAGIPGVVKFIGKKTINAGEKGGDSRQTATGIIVTEFYEITLYDFLKNKKFTAGDVIDLMRQTIATLKKIHGLGCLHLDLKLENILIKNNAERREYFICDFGSCMEGEVKLQLLDRRQKNKLKQFIQANSTLIYRAPEMVQLTSVPITSKADIWMLGCILYMLIYRKHPFQGSDQLGIITANVNYDLAVQLEERGSDEEKEKTEGLKKCLKSMLQLNISDRLDEDQLLALLPS